VLILFDHNIPRGLANALRSHTVVEARARGWHRYKNGELLKAAEEAAFDVLVTSDKSIRYQQNLAGRRIALVVLGQGRWRLVRHCRGGKRGDAWNLHRSGNSGRLEVLFMM